MKEWEREELLIRMDERIKTIQTTQCRNVMGSHEHKYKLKTNK